MAKIDRRMARRRVKPAATGCALARRAGSRTFAANACARIGIRTAPHRAAHPGAHAEPVPARRESPARHAPTPFRRHREPTAYAQRTRGQTMQI
ncbi:hypothetical protein [Burkholderia diffusa]|uniref:hypothetical protein n=1 Tax=Burkholderia diffusa TaxID=488732 RepID=UPI002ABE1C11|nr:hypothetical protein [Burkholderia diffusa]